MVLLISLQPGRRRADHALVCLASLDQNMHAALSIGQESWRAKCLARLSPLPSRLWSTLDSLKMVHLHLAAPFLLIFHFVNKLTFYRSQSHPALIEYY